MKVGPQDSRYDHDVEAETKFKVSGITTPSGAEMMPRVLESTEDMDISYDWGRGAATDELPAHEVKSYIAEATNARSGSQPVEKMGEGNYFTDAPENASEDYVQTGLPNPRELRVDGEIEVSAVYEDGLLGISIDFDTEYVHESADVEISQGHLKVSYAERIAEDADNPIERAQEGLERLENIKPLLD